jgi:hypothetical protein
MRVTKRIREEYETLLKDVGEARFYSHVFGNGVLARRHFERPENMMLDQSDAFFALFRTTGNRNYFTIGRILRRAAHKLYRDSRRHKPNYPESKCFMDIVK